MMKKLCNIKWVLTCLLLLINTGLLKAQAPSLAWVRQVGGSCWDDGEQDAAVSVAVDQKKNVYTSGFFCGTVDFDPGTATYNLSSVGFGSDAFIYKLNASGNFVWAKKIGLSGARQVKIAVDTVGNLYATGSFTGSVDFDPGPDSFKLTATGNGSAFVLKLDTAGAFAWAKMLNGTGSAEAKGIAVDASGNVLTTGSLYSTIDFNPGSQPADTFRLTANGSSDCYISKLNTDGGFVWVKKIGGTGVDQPASIAVDSSGNVYTTGNFKSTVDFDPGAGTANITATGYEDMFISKLTAGGDHVWAKAFLADGTLNPYNRVTARSLAVDLSGNVYSTGTIGGTVDFDPGTSAFVLTSNGPNDYYAFISKLDALGNFAWAKRVKENGYAVKTDTANGVYLSGTFQGTVDMDLGPDTFNLTAAGGTDIFVSKFTGDGNFAWARRLGGTSFEKVYDIAVDPSGKDVYTCGSFAIYIGGQADFDPGPGSLILTASGDADGFVHKMTCNSYTTLTATACDSFVLAGITYTASGIYTNSELPSILGCDSVITLDLTVTNSTHSTINETACQLFTVNGQTYTESGNYVIETLTNAAGCDSFLRLELVINAVNTLVTETGAVLTATETAATYQWIDCSNGNTPIAGATQQTYTALNSASYAVIVTQNDCSDTSACYPVTVTGIRNQHQDNTIRVYPNPVKHNLNISVAHPVSNAAIRISNIVGQVLLLHTPVSGNTFEIDLAAYPAGTYILEIATDDGVLRSKIEKL